MKIRNYDYYIEAKQYYCQLDAVSSGQNTCYEMTMLDGKAAGMKILLENDNAAVYSAQSQPSEAEGIVHSVLSEVDLLNSRLPAVKTTSIGRVFVEKTGSEQHLIICGAGHVSIALVCIAKMVGFKVTVIDDRPAFCNNARAAGADEVICELFAPTLRAIDDSDSPYFVVVTRGHQYDVDCMHEILKKKHRYIGMMGSKLRVRNLKQGLLDEGFSSELLDSLHMPIGLKIGAKTPEEIAVSVIAEIIECRRSQNEDYHYSPDMMTALCPQDTENQKMALTTIVVKKGSGPRDAGTKMLVFEDGRIIGTIGGGCTEAAVIQKARYCIRQNSCALEHVNMTGAEAAENGLVCGGVMDIFIQPLCRK